MKRYTINFSEFEEIILLKLSELKGSSFSSTVSTIVGEWIQNHVETLKELGINPYQLGIKLYEKEQQKKE